MLGWNNFPRGRVSKLWGKAIVQSKPFLSSINWCANLISLTLDYTHALPTFRNGVLHGHNEVENEIKVRGRLQDEIIVAYDACKRDKFIVPYNFRYLFTSKPLYQRVNQDHESLQCWLWSYQEAIASQKAANNRYAEAARKFFTPQRTYQINLYQDFTRLLL